MKTIFFSALLAAFAFAANAQGPNINVVPADPAAASPGIDVIPPPTVPGVAAPKVTPIKPVPQPKKPVVDVDPFGPPAAPAKPKAKAPKKPVVGVDPFGPPAAAPKKPKAQTPKKPGKVNPPKVAKPAKPAVKPPKKITPRPQVAKPTAPKKIVPQPQVDVTLKKPATETSTPKVDLPPIAKTYRENEKTAAKAEHWDTKKTREELIADSTVPVTGTFSEAGFFTKRSDLTEAKVLEIPMIIGAGEASSSVANVTPSASSSKSITLRVPAKTFSKATAYTSNESSASETVISTTASKTSSSDAFVNTTTTGASKGDAPMATLYPLDSTEPFEGHVLIEPSAGQTSTPLKTREKVESIKVMAPSAPSAPKRSWRERLFGNGKAKKANATEVNVDVVETTASSTPAAAELTTTAESAGTAAAAAVTTSIGTVRSSGISIVEAEPLSVEEIMLDPTVSTVVDETIVMPKAPTITNEDPSAPEITLTPMPEIRSVEDVVSPAPASAKKGVNNPLKGLFRKRGKR